jgi:hypothetical protein
MVQFQVSSRNKIAGQIPPSLGNISDDRTYACMSKHSSDRFL